jgi:hypothetical protein
MDFLSGRPLLYSAASNSTVEADTGRSRACFQIFILLSVVLFVAGALQPAGAQPLTEEYKVKAAFLFHFAQLVEWPADALSAENQSLNLCVFGDEPRLQELQSTLEGKLIGTRVLHVRLLSQQQGSQGCNVLFLSRDVVRRQAAALRSLRGQPILTVGETDNFLSDGGMIRLRLEADKIRFDINTGAADSSHLKISSRLLLLAASVTLGDGAERGKSTYAH